MKAFNKILEKICKFGYYLSAIGIVAIMALISIDVALRFIFNIAILGSYEIVEVVMSIAVFMSFAYTQTEKGHVHVTMLISKLPRKPRFICFAFTSLLSTIIVGAISYSAFMHAGKMVVKGTSTGVLAIPFFPFYYIESVAMALFTLVLLGDAIKAIMAIFNNEVAQEIESTWT